MRGYSKVMAALGIIVGSLLGQPQTAAAAQHPVTAIDIPLEADETMMEHAAADNARLLKVFPKGFTLDAAHHPHVSLLQRYVRTADLDKVYAAADEVLAKEKAAGWKLKAFKYYYIPAAKIGLAGIVVKPTADLLRLQQEIDRRRYPFHGENGDCCGVREHARGSRHRRCVDRIRRHVCPDSDG